MRSSVLALSHPALLSNVVMSGIYIGVLARSHPAPRAFRVQRCPEKIILHSTKSLLHLCSRLKTSLSPWHPRREFVARRNHEYHHAHGSAEHSIFKVATRMKRPRQHVLGRWGCIININTEIYISLVARVCIKTTISCV